VLRYVPALLSLALTVYCVIDAFQTDQADMRNLPKVAWVMLVLLLPVLGPVGWLLAGRPRRNTPLSRSDEQRRSDRGRDRGPRRPLGPDDDPDFLKDL
jgi:hypothetical protein